MKLEHQVISLEISKQLKALGVEQDSLFYWWQPEDAGTDNYIILYQIEINDAEFKKCISAFTASELLELMPYNLPYMGMLRIGRQSALYPERWVIIYEERLMEGHFLIERKSNNLANACGEMLIHLIENGYVKV
jgi:hypothetical protein